MNTEERRVDVDEVAVHLGVARDTVYRWIEARGFPAYRAGRLLRFKLSEVDACVVRSSDAGEGANARGSTYRSAPTRAGKLRRRRR